MDDRTLLEKAAKAAGITLEPTEIQCLGRMVDPEQWSRGFFDPLNNDGDAFRLACTLRMSLNFTSARNAPDTAYAEPLDDVVGVDTTWTPESMRRAIVRAAAALADSDFTTQGKHDA